MSKIEQLKARAAQQAAVSMDMNEAETGGGGRLIPKGIYLGRFVEYVDLGMQPEEVQGQAKDPCPQMRVGVALFGEGVQNEDGTPYVLRSSNMSIKRNEKSNAYKMFTALNYKNDPDIKHFAQFLGDAFIFHVDVRTAKKSQRQYNTVIWDKTQPAVEVMSGKPYDVPQVPDDMYRVFLWDFPTQEDWDALYIEGQRDDGSSKNFIQETILGALNYEGSALQQMLGGQVQAAPQAVQAPEQATPTAPTAPVAPSAPAAPAAPVEAPSAPVAPVAPTAPALPVVPGTAPELNSDDDIPL